MAKYAMSWKSRIKVKHYFRSFSLWKTVFCLGVGGMEVNEEMGLCCAETTEILTLQETHHVKGFHFCTTACMK